MASKKNIIKRKDIPLNVVTSAKRWKIKHIKATVKSTKLESSSESPVGEFNDDGYMFEETAADETDIQQTSSHTKRKQRAAKRWEFVQSAALSAVVVTMAEPQLNCAVCKESAGMVKCYQCGPQLYYCKSCATEIHQNSLFHHYMEIWQVNTYMYVHMSMSLKL